MSSAKTANVSADKITGHLRPQRSATGPMAMAAIIKPMSAAEKTEPKFFRGIAKFSRDGGRQETNALRIESVQQKHQAAQNDRGDLEPAQRLPVDNLAYAERARPGAGHDGLLEEIPPPLGTPRSESVEHSPNFHQQRETRRARESSFGRAAPRIY